MDKKAYKKIVHLQRKANKVYKLLQRNDKLESIYKNVAKNTGFSVDEIKHRMKQPINEIDFTKEQGLTYEECLLLFILCLES